MKNKTIRNLENAAIEAVHVMTELAELLEGGGSIVQSSGGYIRPADQCRASDRLERLRIASAELDRAETACSRERTLTMSEEEMREEFEALGLDYDETTERGQAMLQMLQRLLAEHDARREAEIAAKAGELGFAIVGPRDHLQTAAPGLGDGGKSELSYWYDLIEKDAMAAEAFPLAPDHGLKLTVLDVPPDTSEPMVFAPLNAGPSLVYKPLALGPGGDFNRVEIPDAGWRAQALEAGVVAGAPVQIILGEIEPGGDVSLVTIIGFIETQVGAFWVSDHAVKWLRGPDGDAGPVSADLLPEKDVDRGRFSLTAQQDAALSQHFEDSAPLTIETLAQAEQRAAEARWGRLR